MTSSPQKIACQQVLVEDASVFSIQWSTFPSAVAEGLTAKDLLERYLKYIRRCTAGLIRPRQTTLGIQFCLVGSRLSLISFATPAMGDLDCTLNICGGVLVSPQQCDRGQLRFTLEPDSGGVKIVIQLSDYCPLLLGSPSPSLPRRWLYRLTQATLHRLVTVRFLTLLYRDLTGHRAGVTVEDACVRKGRPT